MTVGYFVFYFNGEGTDVVAVWALVEMIVQGNSGFYMRELLRIFRMFGKVYGRGFVVGPVLREIILNRF